MKLLLIDDELLLGELVAATLRDLDASVDQAETCVEGERLVRAAGYDLVLMDYGLAGKDGLECIRDIRGACPEIPIVMLTGHCSEALAEAVFSAGADDYVVKTEMTRVLEHAVWSAQRRRSAAIRRQADTARRLDNLRQIREGLPR